MSAHESLHALLALSAAGALDTADERRVREHANECPACAAELDQLREAGASLRELPCELPPAGLVERTQALVVAELASRVETRLSDAALAAMTLFGWAVAFAAWVLYRLASGGGPALMETNWTSAAWWMAASTMVAWVTASAAAVLLGRRRRPERSL
jgi:hypothetical protein